MRTRFGRTTIRWGAAAVVFALLSALPVAAQSGKIRIAVVDFSTDALEGGWHYSWSSDNLARAASDNLTMELVKSGKFRVIERQQLDRVLQEQNLGESGRLDASTAARLGKVLGVQLIVIGSVIEFGFSEKEAGAKWLGSIKGFKGTSVKATTGKGKLTARLVDTTTAEILGAYEGASSHTFAKAEFAGANLGTEWNSGMASKILSSAVQKLAKDIAAGAANVTPSAALADEPAP